MTVPHEVIVVTAKMTGVRDTKAHLFALHVAASLGCGHCLVRTDVRVHYTQQLAPKVHNTWQEALRSARCYEPYGLGMCMFPVYDIAER